MVVQHNLTAMNANRQLGITTGQQAKSSEKLSSGYKINRAADCCRNRKWQKRGMSYVVWIFGGCVDPANAGLHDDEAE